MKAPLLKSLLCVISLSAIPMGKAHAMVTNIAYWRCGEDDTPAPAGKRSEANATTHDSTGNGHDLTRLNNEVDPGPFYTYPGAVPASSVALGFDPEARTAFCGTAISGLTANWGIQCYTKSTSNGCSLISNGDSNLGGFGIFICNNHYSGVVNGIVVLEGNVTPDGKWHDVALVNDSGTLQLFVDGALDASTHSGGAKEASGFLTLGTVYNGNTTAYENHADGDIDEVRIFTFAEGQFEEPDLKGYVGVK